MTLAGDHSTSSASHDLDCVWIALTGPPGSGKSAVRSELAAILGVPSYDIIDCYPVDSAFSQQDASAAFECMLTTLKSHPLRTHAVIEAMFYQPDRRARLTEFAWTKGARLVFVGLDASLDTLMRRVASRKNHFKASITPERVAELQERFHAFHGDLSFRTDDVAASEIASRVASHVASGNRTPIFG
jgi:predicted kinase